MLTNTSATLPSAALVVLFVAGCSTTSDPEKGGLMGGIHGLSSGEYEQRVRERNNRLSRLNEAAAELKAKETDLQRTKHARAGAYRRQKRKLNDISRRLRLAAGNVKAEKTMYADRQQQNKNLKKQISRLRARIGMILKSLDRPETKKSRVNREVDDVESDYKDLLGLPK